MKEYKIVMLGTGGVGKSALTLRYVQGLFVPRYNPTIEDFYRHQTKLNDEDVVVEILDTAGTEQYSAMNQLYIDHGQAFVLVYSIDNRQSFEDLHPLVNNIMEHKKSRSFPIVIVGNKCDLERHRDIPRTTTDRVAREHWNVHHIETSAKDNINVSRMFNTVLNLVTDHVTREREKRYAAAHNRRKRTNCCVLL